MDTFKTLPFCLGDFPTLRQLLITHVQINRDLFKDEEISDLHYDLEWAINHGVQPMYIRMEFHELGYTTCTGEGRGGVVEYPRIHDVKADEYRGKMMLIFFKEGSRPLFNIMETISHPPHYTNNPWSEKKYAAYSLVHNFEKCRTCQTMIKEYRQKQRIEFSNHIKKLFAR